MAKLSKKEARVRRHRRIRGKIYGTADIPRMSVFCSGRQVYVQLIDDDEGLTLVSASTVDKGLDGDVKGNTEGAAQVGRLAAERALAKDIKKVVFDRGGFKYHGRVRALADAAREAGLEL